MLDMTETQAKGDARPLLETEINRAKKVGAAMSRKRREYDFAIFRENAAAFFRKPPFYEAHERMAARSDFKVAVAGETSDPGATMTEGRTVEIGYGDYAIDQFDGLSLPRLAGEWKGAQEAGAAMMFAQSSDGGVTALLYPARIDGMKQEEDAIVLARYGDIAALTGKGALERHWRDFRAYAEVTALEGEPTLSDHARVAWLRFICPLVRDGRRRRAEALDLGTKLAGLTAGLALGAALISLFI